VISMETATQVNMRPIWDALLYVYEEFAQVCNNLGLRFYLAEGSAIGALRHKGFIPWDDDLDVIMPRPDYECFRRVCDKELPSHLKFVNYENAPEFQYTFGKIQDVRRDKVLEVEKAHGAMLPGGIYIDILVVDGKPDGFFSSGFYNLRRLMFVCQQRFRTFKLTDLRLQGKLFWMVGALISVFHPFETWSDLARRYEAFMKSVPFETAKNTWRDSATYRTARLTYTRKIWDGYVNVPFDGLLAPLPVGYDIYLRAQYGDYMTPPPKEKQQTTHKYMERCPWWLGPTRDNVP